jgi:predicted helicase
MTTVHEVIDAFARLPNTAERGTAFEELMVRYFQLDPVLSRRYGRVWRWKDWPGRSERTGLPDTGIDLVAEERDTGLLTAVQCKFYDPKTQISRSDVDSFIALSGKKHFANRIFISTTSRWNSNAETVLLDQDPPVQRIGPAHIADAPIDWDIAWPAGQLIQVELRPAVRHEPRPHQRKAVDAVFAGFDAGHDRGKLIMACGTGKTFTALKIAERTASENGGAARILFLVPSISLLSQTLREWSGQVECDMRPFAVCSDSKVSRAAEDISVHDVAIPVTTDPKVLAAEMAHRKRAAGLTVVFSTYQSLPTVAEAQAEYGVDDFDLVICDEAHRTTGVTLAGDDGSNFLKVHDADYLRAGRRLYMTATPRIYDDRAQAQAEEHSAQIASMDDQALFGPEFHRLPFGEAVEAGLLTDYRVLVLTVDEGVIAGPLQAQLAAEHGELQLDDASKIVGCWNGLAKRAGTGADGLGFATGEAPMRRAVAFARDIKTSKQLAAVFPPVIDAYRGLLGTERADRAPLDAGNLDLACATDHVDGTMSALERGRKLQWLKAPIPDGECRILTNARCLAEGVDVPALDAVLFMNPRSSVVDVVQSVGRVMRRAPGKHYGYIILPVAVPAGIEPSRALADNKRFRVVWQVLNALRAHDERFDAMVNSIALSKPDKSQTKGTNRLLGSHIGPTADDEYLSHAGDATPDGPSNPAAAQTEANADLARQMALFSLSEWQEAIFARIVDKVGTRVYWEQWAADVADIAARLTTRIDAVLANANASGDQATTDAFGRFHQGLKDNLNDGVTKADAVAMLAQHLITRPVFDALFSGHRFAAENPVSKAMEQMAAVLGDAGLDAETDQLEGFYASVARRAQQVTGVEARQQLIAELYERFFRIGFAKTADAMGVVYTPVEVVDFILRAADTALRAELGRGLSDPGVHVLDPFTGTGTFITRLLQSGLVKPDDLARKYASELHANEILLLAYYIATINIETTYEALTAGENHTGPDGAGRGYEPFAGIVLADTFQITEAGDTFDTVIFPQNNERITDQLATPINVIVGNPPYSVGQTSANDLNANIKYPTLDARIADTYAAKSTATNKNSLYDSYVRALRWATDRIGDAGVVAFVMNGGWIDGNTADGIRLSLADEYSALYVYNLRGNQRTAGELSRREGGKVFGAGSRNTIAILVAVKNRAATGPCRIFYRDIGDYLSREEKLDIIGSATLDAIDWQGITPNQHGDWINQRDDTFATWPAIGDKRKATSGPRVFANSSAGLQTNRDAWVYSYSRPELLHNVGRLVANYNAELEPFARWADAAGLAKPDEKAVTDYLTANPAAAAEDYIKWSSSLRQDAARGTRGTVKEIGVRRSAYRPFQAQWAYFDCLLNHRRGELLSMFPTPHHDNLGIVVMAPREGTNFAALATNSLPDLSFFTFTGQFFPRWTYEKAEHEEDTLDFVTAAGDVDEWGYRRIDNITDDILVLYRQALGTAAVTKDDIFFYIYGLLHSPRYREAYAADLKKMLPRIPTPSDQATFERLRVAGRALADLHAGYEAVEPYELTVTVKSGADPGDRETWRVGTMRWGQTTDPETGKKLDDHSVINYNHCVTISGIPKDADSYLLGSRTALAWLLDRYRVSVDKPSGIVNDPNDWCDEHKDPTYIVELIKKVTTVSVETMRIVARLDGSELE